MLKTDILIVDDDAQMRVAMSETLKRTPYTISAASSGHEALQLLKSTQFRLVISDLRMPGITGFDILREVKSVSPRTQVLLVTAHATVDNAVEAMKLGAFDYLVKPFSPPNLLDVVERALRKNESFHSVSKSNKRFPMITQDPDVIATLELAEHAAKGRATVLIQAESGTGKELLARWIHQSSLRRDAPFVAVNCAALPENLLEAELFGYEKGAFTGAHMQKPGKFELAQGGTILLDEVGEMVPVLQAKLLRVLQEQEVDRLGGRKPIPLDVRVVATTNRDLRTLVRQGIFREDLYYRLNVIRLSLPPLRSRKDDAVLLAKFFCEKYGIENGGRKMELAPETIQLITRYEWPGNVRELENAIQRGTSLCFGPTITPLDLSLGEERVSIASPAQTVNESSRSSTGIPAGLDLKAGVSVSAMERKLIEITLAETGGNRTHAAQLLGISLRTLRNKLREYRDESGNAGVFALNAQASGSVNSEMRKANGQSVL